MQDMLAYRDASGLWDRIAQTAGFNLSLLFLALSAWFWARTLLKARFGLVRYNPRKHTLVDARSPGGYPVDPAAFVLLPRYLFVLLGVSGAVAELKSADWLDLAITTVWLVAGLLFLETRHRLFSSERSSTKEPARGEISDARAVPENTAQPEEETNADTAANIDIAELIRSAVAATWRALANLSHAASELAGFAPFSSWVAWGLLVLGLLAFLLSATSIVPPLHGVWEFFVVSFLGSLPGPSALLICFALMIGPLSFLTYLFRRASFRISLHQIDLLRLKRPPVLSALLAVVVLTSGLVPLHDVRVIEPEKASVWPSQRIALKAEFLNWQKACAQDVGPQETYRPVIVAVSGGASRAGLWAARVLTAIDEKLPPGRTSIFAISSVSGGSLGAAEYLSTLAGQSGHSCLLDRISDTHLKEARETAFAEGARRDALGPALVALLFGDAAKGLLGLPASGIRWAIDRFGQRTKDCNRPLDYAARGGDRAEALERAFERNWEDASQFLPQARLAKPLPFSSAFLSLFYTQNGSPRTNIPIWIANGTDDQSGDRIITAPFAFDDDVTSAIPAARDALALLGTDIPVSTAISNTARFPYLSPSGELAPVGEAGPANPAQIIDGGYFENDGLQTALDLASWLRLQGNKDHAVEPIVVQVTSDADPNVTEREIVRCYGTFRDAPDQPVGTSRPLQLMAPIEGVYTARSGHSNVALRDGRRQFCWTKSGQSFFHFYLYSTEGHDIPLNWLLSSGTADYIWRHELKCCGNKTEFMRLQAVLGAR